MAIKLSKREETIYNEGERLIPFVTHNLKELARHHSSYDFFRRVIMHDRQTSLKDRREISILDLGFGVGHGCKHLSTIPGTRVVGIDISTECLAYAYEKYNAPNIEYRVEDIASFLRNSHEFDYIISRGVLEHVPNGLHLASLSNYTQRLMFNVPYNEPSENNQHHVITGIKEEHLSSFPSAEIFYEDLNGTTYSQDLRPLRPNMITCIVSRLGLPPIGQSIQFPLPPALPRFSFLKNLAFLLKSKL